MGLIYGYAFFQAVCFFSFDKKILKIFVVLDDILIYLLLNHRVFQDLKDWCQQN